MKLSHTTQTETWREVCSFHQKTSRLGVLRVPLALPSVSEQSLTQRELSTRQVDKQKFDSHLETQTGFVQLWVRLRGSVTTGNDRKTLTENVSDFPSKKLRVWGKKRTAFPNFCCNLVSKLQKFYHLWILNVENLGSAGLGGSWECFFWREHTRIRVTHVFHEMKLIISKIFSTAIEKCLLSEPISWCLSENGPLKFENTRKEQRISFGIQGGTRLQVDHAA